MNSWFHTATLAKLKTPIGSPRGSLVRIPLGVRDFELDESHCGAATLGLGNSTRGSVGVYCVMHLT